MKGNAKGLTMLTALNKLLAISLLVLAFTGCNEHQGAEPFKQGNRAQASQSTLGNTQTERWLEVVMQEYGDSGVIVNLQASVQSGEAPVEVSWVQVSGPDAVLVNPTQLSAKVILPWVTEPTRMTFEITASRGGETVVAQQAVIALPLTSRADVVNPVLTGENNSVAIELAEPVAANTAVSLVASGGSAVEGVDFAALPATVTTTDGTRIEIPIQVLPSNRTEDVYTKIGIRAGDGGDVIVVTVVIPANVAKAVAAAASTSAALESSSSSAGFITPSSAAFSSSSVADANSSSPNSSPSSVAVSSAGVSSAGFSSVELSSMASSASSIAEDNNPAPFVFAAQNDVAPNTLAISNTINVSDINNAAAISITGGEYSIDGGAFTSAAGTVTNGQSVQVRQLSSNALGATTMASLTVGGLSADFNVTTYAVEPRPFITTWKTDNFGSSLDDQIRITTRGAGYDYFVDWGDGSTDSNVTGDITHTYASPGTYTVSISGDFPQLYFRPTVGHTFDSRKLLSVEQWGTTVWRSMHRFFRGCSYLEINATDVPNLSRVTNMSEMFADTFAFNQDISGWDVSGVTNMESMFEGASGFNQDLGAWDVSAVKSMRYMFSGASSFNQDLSSWDVSAVTDMLGMFNGARSFNQGLSGWDVSAVTDMTAMFEGALAFNQDLSGWDVSAVIDMSHMFDRASSFSQNLSSWDTSAVTTMVGMFRDASIFNEDLSGWDVSAVTRMENMFWGASSFNQELGSWDVSAVTNMRYMFYGASAFNQDLSSWDVSGVTNMESMFNGATTFNQDLSGWDVSAVLDMSWMFAGANAFNQGLSVWNVSAVINMHGMFEGATLSTPNYDALLIGWSARGLQNSVRFDGGNSQYSSAAQAARDVLTTGFDWTITDGGLAE